jgi:hypothetical protein
VRVITVQFYSSISFGEPFFGIAVTTAYFHSSGNLPTDLKLENMRDRGSTILNASFLITTGGMLSGPQEVPLLSLFEFIVY